METFTYRAVRQAIAFIEGPSTPKLTDVYAFLHKHNGDGKYNEVIEKLSFGLPMMILLAQGRVAPMLAAGGVIDLSLGVLFAIAYVRTPAQHVAV